MQAGYSNSTTNTAYHHSRFSIFTYQRIKTGSWLDWAVVAHTQAKGRRGVVLDEDDLKTLKQVGPPNIVNAWCSFAADL